MNKNDIQHREQLGKIVRNIWIAWAREQPNTKPSWVVPWEGLSESDKEVDRIIGETLFWLGVGEARKDEKEYLSELFSCKKEEK